MALIGINQVQEAPKRGKLDTVAAAIDIAANVLGMGLSVPKFIQDRKLGKMQEAKTKAEIGESTEVAKEGEEGAFEVPGMGYRKSQPSLARILQEKKVEEEMPVTPELKAQLVRLVPEAADVEVGLTQGQARELIQNKLKSDPRLDLALKQFDLTMEQFKQGKVKEDKKEFGSKFETIKDRVNKIKDPLLKDMASAYRAEQLINTGQTVGTNVALTIIAKSVGRDTGAVSEGDVKRYLPQSLWGEAKTFLNYMRGSTDVQLTEEQQKAMLNVVRLAAQDMRKELAFQVMDEMELQSAGDDQFFSDPRVKNYVFTLEKQIPGIKKARVIRGLERQLEENPNDPRADEIRATTQQLLDTF